MRKRMGSGQSGGTGGGGLYAGGHVWGDGSVEGNYGAEKSKKGRREKHLKQGVDGFLSRKAEVRGEV